MNDAQTQSTGGSCCDDSACPSNNPYVRETRKVGRNDPCPCDSGRKFKKCCGAAAQARPAAPIIGQRL
ncbi:MAG: SEC-C metal-binding domain-containing protein [Pseudomonadota bacterium]